MLDGITALVVPDGNVNKLVSRVLEALSSISLRDKLREAGRQFVMQHFTVNRTQQELKRVFL